MYAFLKNPLNSLVLTLGTFLFLGIEFLSFSITWLDVFAILSVAVFTEFLFVNIGRRIRGEHIPVIFFPASALAAAFGIALFFRALSPFYFALAAFLAISSKYLIRTREGHVFNPSNFAIVTSAFVFSSATTIEFTQWGSNPYIFSLITAVSVLVAWRARVLPITVSFVSSYVVLLFSSMIFLPSIFSAHHFGLIGPSFVLFASFMITDPKVTPQGFRARILHGFSIAALYFLLEAVGVRYALFVASFGISGLNLFCRLLTKNVRTLSLFSRGRPSNIVSTTFVSILLLLGSVSLVSNYHSEASVNMPSPRFILLGVEAPEIFQCSDTPIFKALETSGTEKKQITYGAAWGDIDNDGDDDLFVSRGGAGGTLYKNNGNSTFTDITGSMGVTLNPAITSAVFVDYDNDGLQDIFTVSGITPFAYIESGKPLPSTIGVYKNKGNGSFKDVTNEVGLSDFQAQEGLGSLSFADYNGDGLLDFVLTRVSDIEHISSGKDNPFTKAVFDGRFGQNTWFICDPQRIRNILEQLGDRTKKLPDYFDVETFVEQGGCMVIQYNVGFFDGDLSPTTEPVGKPISHATLMTPGGTFLFENHEGVFVENRAFAEVMDTAMRSTSTGPLGRARRTNLSSRHHWQVVSFDYNDDSLTDIFLSVDVGTNRLFKNNGGFTFTDVTEEVDITYDGTGMGIDVSDYNADGLLDIVVSNTWKDYLFEGTKNGAFTNKYNEIKIGQFGVGWGVSFVDYDLDGWDDIFLVNGDMLNTIRGSYQETNRALFQVDRVYKNIEGKTFVDVSHEALCSGSHVGRALAISDIDNDGDPDAFVGNLHSRPGGSYEPASDVMFENTINKKPYLKIKLHGTESNRDGIGAVVSVSSGNHTQTKPLLAGNSFYSQNSKVLLFGFGDHDGLVDVSVKWPSGKVSEISNVSTGQTIEIIE